MDGVIKKFPDVSIGSDIIGRVMVTATKQKAVDDNVWFIAP